MARFIEPTPKQQKGWNKWIASRPPNVRAVAEKLEPWSLYRMKPDGQRVTLISLSEGEDGTVTLTVAVTGEFNLTMFDRQVFGVDPDSLEPCDLPQPDEPTGAMMTGEEVDDNIDALRALVRPDLFSLDEKGNAIRKN